MLHIRSTLSQRRNKLTEAGVAGQNPEIAPGGNKQKAEGYRSAAVRSLVWVMLVGMVHLSASCEKEEAALPDYQPVWFEYHYINHAWGYQEYGWLVDGDGDVRYFHMPEDYVSTTHGSYLTLEELNHNLSQTDSVIATVSAADLAKYTALIPEAAEGTLNERRNIAADAGASSLSCYLYDPEKDAYQYIFLGQSGDWEHFNTSKEAETLVEWLQEFDVFWISD